MAFLLGLDVGTSSAKAVLINVEGAPLGAASINHQTYAIGPDHKEQDADDWWMGTCTAIRRVLDKTGVDPRQIAGLSLSGQGCACLPVDAAGAPLSRAMIWTDTRAAVQDAYIRNLFGDGLGLVTGNELYDQPEPRMMWLRDNAPDLYARTACFLSTVSYLSFRLTGGFAANTSDWGYHLAFDRARLDWNQDFLSAVGLTSARFPRLYAPHEMVGRVTARAAAESGLTAGTPVVAGGQDATLSALAVGVLEPGHSVTMRGTTDLISACTADPGYHPRLYTTCAVLPDLFMSYDMQDVVASGGSYRWLAHLFYGATPEGCYDEMNRLAEESPAGARGVLFLPYLLVPPEAPLAAGKSGVFFGMTATTDRGDLCRAVMEGTAYALRQSLARMADAGIVLSELRAAGGPARSRLWNQITADITGLPLATSRTDASAAHGAALLAGLGVGLIPMDDGYETLRRLSSCRDLFAPASEHRPVYDRGYALFQELAGVTARLKALA